ncbi:MAG: thioredoxin domain-containing protein [Novosphingobium sp.]
MPNLPARRLGMIAMLAPLALGLAACGKGDDGGGAVTGEPIAKIAPPAGKAWGETVAVTADGGYLMGNPDAPIKLVEYGALSCSHCAEFSETGSAELRDSFVASGRVSWELRYYMLNALDVPATLLATCGATDAVLPLSEQFWAWQPTMFENLQKADPAQLQAASSLPAGQQFAAMARLGGMDTFFASRGIAAEQGQACLADTAKATALAAQRDKASKDMGITGTPTFFVNGRKLEVNTWKLVKADLERAGAR